MTGEKEDVRIVRTGPKQVSVLADKVSVDWLDAQKITVNGKALAALLKKMQDKIDTLTEIIENQPKENKCTCTNGSPATGDACKKDGASLCQSCKTGFALNEAKTQCKVAGERVCVEISRIKHFRCPCIKDARQHSYGRK